jgi:beta-lactamase superfamily II metal-dependent hydrolase
VRRLGGLIAIVLLALWAPGVSTQEPPPPPPLRVHFIDVGQGDATLIQSPSGQNVMYDAGEHPTRVRDYLIGLGISTVSLVIASHNHADHIGGLAEVVRHFRPQFYMDNAVPATTQTYARLQEAVSAAGSQLLEPTARRITAGDASLEVVPPPGVPEWDHNDNSIGVVIEYGAFRLSLAGDAEPREWAWWRTHASEWLRPVHVHKASHHGSSNGDTPEGVAMLAPKSVVIGVGAGNPYGHPDQAALQLYANAAAQVFRTDNHGTVIVEAQLSGAYTVSVERGEGAQPPPPPPPSPPPPSQSSCIDINRAGFMELQEIIHIGPDRAQQIIDLRRIQLFRSVDDLIRVDGIGPARLADIKAQGKACVR